MRSAVDPLLAGMMVRSAQEVSLRQECSGSGSERAEAELKLKTEELIIRRLCSLLDAEDIYDRYSSLSVEEKLKRQFLATAEDRAKSEQYCTTPPESRLQAAMLFKAVAGVIEELSGSIIQSSVELNSEGFGRALLYSGRVILVLKSLRAGFPFPFVSQDQAARYGAAAVEEGLAFLEKYHAMTALHGTLSLEG